MEFLRILSNKKTIILFCIVIASNVFLFSWKQTEVPEEARWYYNDAIHSDYNSKVADEYKKLLKEYKSIDYNTAYENLNAIYDEYNVMIKIKELEAYDTKGQNSNSSEYYATMTEYYKTTYPVIWEKYVQNPKDYLYVGTRQDESFFYYKAVGIYIERLKSIIEYPTLYNNMQTRADKLNILSIFKQKDSFSSRNINKTLRDYGDLKGIELKAGNDFAVTAFFKYKIADFFAIIFVLFIVIQFIDERKLGLWGVIHAMPKGRSVLSIKRAMIIFASSLLAAILLYGSVLLAALIQYGGYSGLNRSIQSLEICYNSKLEITILSMLILYVLGKALVIFLLGLVAWLFISSFNSINMSILLLGSVIGAEYLAFQYIPVQSNLNLLKYINVFSYMDVYNLITVYNNINLFDYPVDTVLLTEITLPVITIFIMLYTIYRNSIQYPVGSVNKLAKCLDYAIKRFSPKSGRVSLFKGEGYKILHLQKGFVLFVVLIWFAHGMIDDTEKQYSDKEILLNRFYTDLEGPINAKTMQYLEKEQEKLNSYYDEINLANQQYENGEISYDEFSKYTLLQNNCNLIQEALDRIQSRVNRLQDVKKKTHFNVWLVNPNGYNALIGQESISAERNGSLIILFFLTLMLSGVIAFEYKNNTASLLRTQYKGRNNLLRSKMIWSLIISLMVCVPVYLVQIRNVVNRIGLPDLRAPIQSLAQFDKLTIPCSIGLFLGIVFLLRYLLVCSIAFWVLLISSYSKKYANSFIINLTLFVIPSCLFYIEIKQAGYISLLKPLGITELWLKYGTNSWIWYSICGMILLAGVISICLVKKKWNVGTLRR